MEEMSLEERLHRLESIEGARGVLASYADACDAQDLSALAELFADGCELEVPGQVYRGQEEVGAFYRQAFADDPTRKSHFITNIKAGWRGAGIVALDSYFLYTAAGDTSSVLGWGEYHDVITTAGKEPAFARKSITIRRAVDVREGWALAGATADAPPGTHAATKTGTKSDTKEDG
jgi:3-phenylpropionate/cinnamic acid dioxygenase small subunit